MLPKLIKLFEAISIVTTEQQNNNKQQQQTTMSSTSIKSVMCPGKGCGHDVSRRIFGDWASMPKGHIIPLSQMLPSGLCMGCSPDVADEEEEEEEEEEVEELCKNCDDTYMGHRESFCIMGSKNCGKGLPHITELYEEEEEDEEEDECPSYEEVTPTYTVVAVYEAKEEDEKEDEDEDVSLKKKIGAWLSDRDNHEGDLIDFLCDECGIEFSYPPDEDEDDSSDDDAPEHNICCGCGKYKDYGNKCECGCSHREKCENCPNPYGW